MGFLKDIIRNRKYRKKESVTPEEFLDAIQRDLRRKLDPESSLFFRHHPVTVNLVNNILAGRLTQSGDKNKDGLVIQALIAEMTEYMPSVAAQSDMAAVVEEFSKWYNDAGNIIGQALVAFFEAT